MSTGKTEQKEEIRAAIDIVEFINDTIAYPLKKYGDVWKGAVLSSSSGETSLVIGPDPTKWHDFAAGVGGNDVYSWIAYRENLDNKKDFRKILKIAADYAGIKLKNTCNNEEKDQVFDVLQVVAGYYNRCLTDEMRQHISNKWGIDNETIDNLKIGYAPPNDPAGLQMAMKDVIQPDDLKKAGLIYDSGINLYRGRVVFPYWENGKAVYTIGRATDSTPDRRDGKRVAKYIKQMVYREDKPNVSKYINNDVIYGIDSVKGVDEVVITEGITDAIVLLQAGIPTISPITTSFKGATFSRVLQLLKDKKYIYICNDNEEPKGDDEKGAGEKGALKTIKALNEAGHEVRYIQLPKGDDVDKIDLAEYMKDHSVEDFRSLMDEAIVHSAAKVARSYRMDDTGNGERMLDLHGENLLYSHDANMWYHWDGFIWKEDHAGHIQKLAKNTVETIHDYAASLPDGDIETDGGAVVKEKSNFKKKWQKHASSSGATPRRKAMVENLKSEDGIPVNVEDFDLNDWILPVQNGTIDLKTRVLRESLRSDMCTKVANVCFDPAAKCPEFDKFFSDIQPDPDTRRYIQECLGHALTGDTTEEQIFFFYGTGWNGKNTLLDVVAYIMGQYSKNIESKTLLTADKQSSTTDYEVARLKGCRHVTASEPEKGATLNDARIKTITNSCAKITARNIYQAPFDFFPSHKLFFSANERPFVKDNSRGTWRRIRVIPFDVDITEDNRDTKLPAKLKKEASGIFNWLLEGCRSWQEAGKLRMSEEVELATSEYREDMDMVLMFLNTIVIKGNKNDTVSNNWLMKSYNIWAAEKELKTMNFRTFGTAMKEHGYKKDKLSSGVHWKGLKIDITNIDEISRKYPLVDYKQLFEIVNKMNKKLINEKPPSVTVMTDNDGKMTDKTPSVTIVTVNNETLNNTKKEKGIEYIYEIVSGLSVKPSFTSPDSGSVEKEPSLSSPIAKTENNNDNGSCNDAKNESLNKKIGNELQEIHKDVNIDQMCRDIWKHRHSKSKENGNGSFSSIDDIDIFKFGFVSSVQGKKWQGRESVVIEVLNKIVEHENNGGLTA